MLCAVRNCVSARRSCWSGTQCNPFPLASVSWCNGASEARPAAPGEAARTEDAGPEEVASRERWPPAESAFRRDQDLRHQGVEVLAFVDYARTDSAYSRLTTPLIGRVTLVRVRPRRPPMLRRGSSCAWPRRRRAAARCWAMAARLTISCPGAALSLYKAA